MKSISREPKISFFESINEKIFDDYEDCYFPPILEESPEEAAKSLTIKDAEEAYEAFTDIFKAAKRERYKLLSDAVYYSYYSFNWFYSFYTVLAHEYKKTDIAQIPVNFKSLLDAKTLKGECLCVYLPFFVLPIKNKYIIYEEDFIKDNFDSVLKRTRYSTEYSLEEVSTMPNAVELHRIKYIKEEYEVQEFKSGYPSWYQFPTKVFEKYNPYINRRVQIQFAEGEFRYYMAGASDNWQEIYDVPLEIDDVVKTLLFKS